MLARGGIAMSALFGLAFSCASGVPRAPATPAVAAPAPSSPAAAPSACSGTRLDWDAARGACRCGERCGTARWTEAIRATLTASAKEVRAGRELDLEVQYVNTGDTVATLDVTDDARLEAKTSFGSVVRPVDSWSSGVGMTTCTPAPVGRVAPLNDVADIARVSLAPGGTLTQKLRWHAGTPERDGRTCGWNYNPLAPGVYRLTVTSPATSNTLDVAVVPPGACRATCVASPDSLSLPFATYPKLARVGESLHKSDPRYVDPVCGQSDVLVAHGVDGVVAVSGACTDRCCAAEFDGSGFECPACKGGAPRRRPGTPHGDPGNRAAYSVDGVPRAPNASVAKLPHLEVCADECAIVVTFPPAAPGN